MLNFSVGPVQMAPDLCDLGANPVPYFRTAEFSQTMLENERLLLSLVNAPSGSRAVFLTGSLYPGGQGAGGKWRQLWGPLCAAVPNPRRAGYPD